MQGRYYQVRFTGEDLIRAIGHFQRAVELDENYALAWAALGRARTTTAFYGFEGTPTLDRLEADVKLARSMVDRALALQPDLPEGLDARGKILLGYDFDWKGAASDFRRALKLAPQNSEFMGQAAFLLKSAGRDAEALQLRQNAVALDPVNPSLRRQLGHDYFEIGRYDEALQEHLRAIELSPDIVWGHAGWAVDLLRQGKAGEAVIEAEKEKTEWARLYTLAMALWQLQETAKSDAALARLIAAYADIAAYQVSVVYTFRGQNDLAFEWLERALRQRDSGIPNLRVDSAFARIQSDPRWPVFLRKVGLADEQVKEWGW